MLSNLISSIQHSKDSILQSKGISIISMAYSPRLLYKLIFFLFKWPFFKTWRWFIAGRPFIWEWNWLCCNSVWYLLNFLDVSIILSIIFTKARALGCVWAGGIVLHSVWGLRGKRHRPKRPLNTLNMSPLISKLPFSNTLYTASANRLSHEEKWCYSYK